MKALHLLVIIAVPISFIGGMGFTVLMSPYMSNGSNHVIQSQIDNATVYQDNGSAYAAVNQNTNRIYVANEIGKTVSAIDGSTNAKIADIHLDNMPSKLSVNPNTNRIYVMERHMINNVEENDTVAVIDGNTNTDIVNIPVGESSQMAVNPNTNHLYVAQRHLVNNTEQNGTVSVIDGNTNTLVGKPIYLSGGVEGIDVDPLNNRIYVADGAKTTMYVIDGNTDSKVDEIRKLSSWDVAVNPATGMIYVPSYFFNNLSVIDGRYDNIVAVIPVGVYPTK